MTPALKPPIAKVEQARVALHGWLRDNGLTSYESAATSAFGENDDDRPEDVRRRAEEIRKALRRVVATEALLRRHQESSNIAPTDSRAELDDDSCQQEILDLAREAQRKIAQLSPTLQTLLEATVADAARQVGSARFKHIDTARLGRDVRLALQALAIVERPLEALQANLRQVLEADPCRSQSEWDAFVGETALSLDGLDFPVPTIAELLGEGSSKEGSERIRARLNRMVKRVVETP